jgi:hypothetical protein
MNANDEIRNMEQAQNIVEETENVVQVIDINYCQSTENSDTIMHFSYWQS